MSEQPASLLAELETRQDAVLRELEELALRIERVIGEYAQSLNPKLLPIGRREPSAAVL